MLAEELAARHPRLFHMAEAGTWPQIQRHGLRSTSALLDLYEVTGPRRTAIESMHRPQMVAISHSVHGRAVIRDTKPLRPHVLERCLEDLPIGEWYRLLNAKVFFWVSAERLERLLNARAYRARPHDVLTIDTAALLARHGESVALSCINSGATIYPSAPRRGRHTFVPLDDFSGERAIVEVTVDYAIPDIGGLVLEARRHQPGAAAQTLWPAPGSVLEPSSS